MKAIGFAGYSGAGKTTLLEQVIALLRGRGLRVSVVKHAHHRFDIDQPGKDSYRHRAAGAFEVLVASDHRLALMREFAQPTPLGVHELIAELDASVDWVLVEGFRHCDLPKVAVWRATVPGEVERGTEFVHDAHVVAVATNTPAGLPADTQAPLFDLDDPAALVQWLVDSGERFRYNVEQHV